MNYLNMIFKKSNIFILEKVYLKSTQKRTYLATSKTKVPEIKVWKDHDHISCPLHWGFIKVCVLYITVITFKSHINYFLIMFLSFVAGELKSKLRSVWLCGAMTAWSRASKLSSCGWIWWRSVSVRTWPRKECKTKKLNIDTRVLQLCGIQS